MLSVPGSNVCFLALSGSDSQQSHQCSRRVIPARDPSHCPAPVSPSRAHSLGRVFHPGMAVWVRGETNCEGKWSRPFSVRGIPPQVSQVSRCSGQEGLGAAELGWGHRGLSRSCAGHPAPAAGHSPALLGLPKAASPPTPQQQQGQPVPGSQRGTGDLPRAERVSPLAPVGPCSPAGIPHPRGSRRDSPGGFGC